MPDLNFLYNKYGVGGIIPNVFGNDSDAYRFLTKKLAEGEELYHVILDGKGIPFLIEDGGQVKALAFSSEEAAQGYCDRKLLSGYALHVEEEGGGEVYGFYGALGVSALKVDEKVSVALTDISMLPEYDGFKGVDEPLRNAALNAELYLGCQERTAGKPEAGSHIAAAVHLMQKGHLLACSICSPITDSGEHIIPYIENEEGSQGLPLFTDCAAFERFLQRNEWANELFAGAEQTILDYKAFRSLLVANPTAIFVLNPCEADFAFTCDSFLGIESAVVIRDAQQEPQDVNDDDPTPDFLK